MRNPKKKLVLPDFFRIRAQIRAAGHVPADGDMIGRLLNLGTDTSPGRPNRENPHFEESENAKNIAIFLFKKNTFFFVDRKGMLIHCTSFPA